MAFTQDQVFSKDVENFYGKYHSTFRSANEQVVAQLFVQGDWLVAHVSHAPGLDFAAVTDPYLSALNRYAKEHDFGDKFRIIYSES